MLNCKVNSKGIDKANKPREAGELLTTKKRNMSTNINEIPENKGTRHPGGRPPKLQNIEEVQKKIDDYFNYCDTNPMIKNDFIRSGEQAGEIIPIPIQRPYTIEGLCLSLGIQRFTFLNLIQGKTEQAKNDIELIELLIRAYEKVRSQQIEGATVNLYNSNLVARMNSIKEQTDITSNDETITAINISFASSEDEE